MSFIFTSYRIKIYLQKCDTSLLIISCGFYMKNNNSWLLTLFPFLLFIVFKFSFKTTFNSVIFPFYVKYVILYHIRKEHYSSTYLLYHCANDWFFGQLHKCSLHHKNMRLCGLWSEDNIRRELSSFVQNIYC